MLFIFKYIVLVENVSFQSISPGAVETEMIEEVGQLKKMNMLKSIDIAEAIMYALSAPQRVNVSPIFFWFFDPII